MPASDLMSRLIGERGAGELLSHALGRPAKSDKKVTQALRLDADVLEAYRRQGSDWQTRINQVLRDHMHDRGK